MMRFSMLLCVLALGVGAASAQDCAPAMRIVVGQAAGGGADAVARVVAQRLGAKLGQTVLVENRTGAGNNIAAEHVSKAPKDGCTLLLRAADHIINTMVYARPGYELKDFVPIGLLVEGPLVIVTSPQQPFKTLGSVIDYAKRNPGKLSYAATAAGSAVHVPMEQFLRVAGIQILHIPYKGAALSLADTAAGFVPLGIGSVSAAQPLITAGKLVPLAVLAPKRWGTLPNVPTMAEAGFADANTPAWMGLFAPAGTPVVVQQKLNREVQSLLQEPAVRDRLVGAGYESSSSTIPEFAGLLQREERTYRKLLEALKLKVE